MTLIDLTAVQGQCRVSVDSIVDVLEQLTDAITAANSIRYSAVLTGSAALPATITLNIINTDPDRTLRGQIIASSSVIIGGHSGGIVVAGHKLFVDGVDFGQNGLIGTEPGWNTVFSGDNDKSLPLIVGPLLLNPGQTKTVVYTVDLNSFFTIGTASSKLAESRVVSFLGGY